MSIIVYSKPDCMQCTATYRALDKEGLDYEVVSLLDNDEARDAVVALGYTQAPVVVTDAEHWSGFRPDKIAELVRRLMDEVYASSSRVTDH